MPAVSNPAWACSLAMAQIDVYKRQGPKNAYPAYFLASDQRPQPKIQPHCRSYGQQRTESVSYTHLDVYKRQCLIRGAVGRSIGGFLILSGKGSFF